MVSRGAKPATALRRYGVVASLTVPSPYTSKEVLGSLPYDLSGTEVTLVHYGERNAILANALGSRGAMVVDLCVYEWQLPADLEPLRDMVVAIVHREVDAVVLTSQVQWKHLLHVAHDGRLAGSMIAALRSDVVVAAVGPVCAAALAESGVHPHVVPSNPKMGPLVAELANYFAMRQRPGAQPPVQVHSGGG